MGRVFLMQCVVISATIFCAGASARIINVPAHYTTIQAGINNSANGDTVLVQPGVYYENINFSGHRIVLASSFIFTADTSFINNTIIDGNNASSVISFSGGEDSTTIIVGFTVRNGRASNGGGFNCQNASPRIENNLIRNNYAIDHGGGIYGRDAIIKENIITNNNSIDAGGGIYLNGCLRAQIIQNRIYANSSTYSDGGGILCYGSAKVYNNVISNNRADGNGAGIDVSGQCEIVGNIIDSNTVTDTYYPYGGGIMATEFRGVIRNNDVSYNRIFTGSGYSAGGAGIYCDGEGYNINDNIIHNNIASLDGVGQAEGGGVFLNYRNNDPVRVFKNIIKDNIATDGGGIFFDECSNILVFNNLIVGNSSGIGSYYSYSCLISNNTIAGNDIGIEGYLSNIQVVNSIIWGNIVDQISGFSVNVSYCNVQDSLFEGDGNISTTPLFRDINEGDYHLMSTACGDEFNSACIDAGDPDITDILLDCAWGLGAHRSDMGAYGGGDSTILSIDGGYSARPSTNFNSRNHPNPFNVKTTIQYDLSKSSDVTLEIFDILGRKIEMPVDVKQEAGHHQITWDGKEFSSGIYFYRLQVGDYAETRKMLLLK